MFSVAGIALLPFLPLLPMQILLTNFLTDLPAMTIAGDHVDPEQVTALALEHPDDPVHARLRPYRTVFDYVTFLMLLLVLHAVDQFRTGWFLESVLSELLILLVILRGSRSMTVRHTLLLFTATMMVALFTLMLPYSPWHQLLGLCRCQPQRCCWSASSSWPM
ncbi:MAG: hypothetical protein R3A10_12205 [Caldilineaceae bacterium]